MTSLIHPTAVINEGSKIGNNVSIGPYSVIGSNVKIGDNNKIESNVVISGYTSIGEGNHFFPFAAIGGAPQSTVYKGEPTEVIIGNNNTFREYVTVHSGTVGDEGVTSLGDNNFIMAYCHIAHDCRLGSHIIFANNASLAGHCHIGNYVTLSAFAKVHQFCRVGNYSFLSADSVCIQDVPPFTLAAGNRATTHGINARGLRRHGFTSDDIMALKRAYKTIYRSGLTTTNALKQLEEKSDLSDYVTSLIDFMRTSKRGVIR